MKEYASVSIAITATISLFFWGIANSTLSCTAF